MMTIATGVQAVAEASYGRTAEALWYMDRIVETFDPEQQNPIEMQRGGWQSILDNFKKYVESNA